MTKIVLTHAQKVQFIVDHSLPKLENNIDKEWCFVKSQFPNDFGWYSLFVNGELFIEEFKGVPFGDFCEEYIFKILKH